MKKVKHPNKTVNQKQQVELNNNLQHENVEFAEELNGKSGNFFRVGGTVTRNLVKEAEQELAMQSGNNPAEDVTSRNK